MAWLCSSKTLFTKAGTRQDLASGHSFPASELELLSDLVWSMFSAMGNGPFLSGTVLGPGDTMRNQSWCNRASSLLYKKKKATVNQLHRLYSYDHCLISNLLPLLMTFEVMIHLTIDGDTNMKKSRIYWLFKIHQLLCLLLHSLFTVIGHLLCSGQCFSCWMYRVPKKDEVFFSCGIIPLLRRDQQ